MSILFIKPICMYIVSNILTIKEVTYKKCIRFVIFINDVYVFFICYSYFHIPCLFSFIVSVSFLIFFHFCFHFHFLLPSYFLSAITFFFFEKNPVHQTNKSIKRRTLGVVKQLAALSTAARSIFNYIGR